MSKHTPGPWEWRTVGIDEEVMLIPRGREKTTGEAVLTLGWVSCGDGTSGKEPSQEDQNLIAAAPDLLEALEFICGFDDLDDLVRDIAATAITKATGGFK